MKAQPTPRGIEARQPVAGATALIALPAKVFTKKEAVGILTQILCMAIDRLGIMRTEG